MPDSTIINIKHTVEAALLAASRPLTLKMLQEIFADDGEIGRDQILDALELLREDYTDRGIELMQVAGGYRIQVRASQQPWVARLWQEKAPRYSRSLIETLAIIAYKQPATRGDIEQIRGVSVATQIIRTLLERNWIKVQGQREVPGRPTLYGTTREFLDHFNLARIEDLPPLAEVVDQSVASVTVQEPLFSATDEVVTH